MKIIILGAGQVGYTLAQHLERESNDITVVDENPEVLAELQDRLDIGTVCGHAAHPAVLDQAGAYDADMIIAVTVSDETNMVACQIAYTLFHTPTKIARIRSMAYISDAKVRNKLFAQEALPIDMLISPEQLVTDHIRRLIRYPGALQVLDFANGHVRLIGVAAVYGSPLVGHELRTLREHIPNVDTRVAAIYRRGTAILPSGDTIIEADDEVFFIAARSDIRKVMSELRELDRPAHRVIIAGGGNIGVRLAESLEKYNYHVKVIERNAKRAWELSERLDSTIVLTGDAADEDLLLEENIENTDVFCAVTNDDEANILSSMLAKKLGAQRVLSLVNRPAYADLISDSMIDIAISPSQATIGSMLAHVRRGDVVVVHSLRRGAAEAIEAIAHGDSRTSQVVGKRVEDIQLPPGAMIAAIARGEEVLMAHHDIEIQAEDHVIIFLVDKQYVPDVERLFQVGVTFV